MQKINLNKQTFCFCSFIIKSLVLIIFVLFSVIVNSQTEKKGISALTLKAITPFTIEASWIVASNNPEKYIIEWSINDESNYKIYATVSGEKKAVDITNLPLEAAKYYVRIRSFNSDDNTEYVTSYIYTKPNCPHGLTATAISGSQIILKWTVNSEYQEGTSVEKSTDGFSGWTEISRVKGQDSAYMDSGLTGTIFFYRVRAYKESSYSPYTHIASNTVPINILNNKIGNNQEICDNYIKSNSVYQKFYVDPSGDDDTGNGSMNKPWASLSKACSVVKNPNSTIIVNKGSYRESNICKLARGVNIMGVGDESCIIFTVEGNLYGSINLDSPGSGFSGDQTISYLKLDGDLKSKVGVGIHYRSNVKITNCTIVNFIDKAILYNNSWRSNDESITATGNEIAYCNIINCSGQNGIHILGQSDMLIHDNVITQTTRKYGMNGVNVFMNKCRDVKYYKNKSYKPEKEDPQIAFHLVSYNSRGGMEMFNNEFFGGGTHLDVAGIKNSKERFNYSWWVHDNLFMIKKRLQDSEGKSVGVSLEGSNSDVIIENNNFINLTGSIAIAIDTENRQCRNIRIRYNIFQDIGYTNQNWGYFIYMYGFRKSNLIENIFIDNNVLFNGNVDAGIIAITEGNFRNLNIRNNIVQNIVCDNGNGWLSFDPIFTYPNRKGWVHGGTIEGVNVMNNIIFDNSNNNKVSPGQPVTKYIYKDNIVSDPLFELPGSDFHLKAGSPAINSGMDVGSEKDYDGVKIKNGPDIGAFEYVPDK